MRSNSQRRLLARSFIGVLLAFGVARAEQPTLNTITGIEVKEAASATRVIVHGSTKPTFTVFKLSDPVRIFIDLSNADISALKAPVIVENGVIEQITPLQFQDNVVRVARLIVALDADARYAVKTQGSSLSIEFDAAKRAEAKPVAVSAAPAPKRAGASSANVKAAKREAEVAKREAEAAKRALAEAQARIKAAEATAQEAKAAEARAMAKAAQAEAMAQAAEARAAKAEGRAEDATELAQRKLQLAEQRAARAEREAHAAVTAAEAARASSDAANAKLEAINTKAERFREAANARLAAAERREREAQARAEDAAKEALAAQQRVASTERQISKLSKRASEADERASEAAKRASEAEQKAARAEANFKALAAKRARLGDEVNNAEARIKELRQAKLDLEKALLEAHQEKDEALARSIEASSVARKAEINAERAKIAQLEAEKASTRLDEKLGRLEGDLAKARAADQSDKIRDLQGRLAKMEKQSRSLQRKIAQKEEAAERAQAEAIKTRKEAREMLAKADSKRARQMAKAEEARKREARERDARRRAEADAKREREARKLAKAEATRERREARKLAKAEKARKREAREERARKREARKAEKARKLAKSEEARKARAAREAKAREEEARRKAIAANTPRRLKDLSFKAKSDSSQIILKLSGVPEAVVTQEDALTYSLQLKGADIPAVLERSLDTSDFRSVVRLVSSFKSDEGTRVVVSLAQPAKNQVQRDGDKLVWTFNASGAAQPQGQGWQPISAAPARVAVYTGPAQTVRSGDSKRQNKARRPRYTGRKVNIDVKDGDIHNILRFLAKEGNVNIVTSDEVSGTVTLHLKLVPWDQALEIVLRTKGLDMVREGNIIRVAPAKVIAEERQAELKKLEVKEKLKPLEIRLVTINHAVASKLIERVKSVMSPRGKAEFDERTNTIILKDVSDHLDASEDMIRRLDTQTPQVLIEARIVEVNSVDEQEFGIQWGGNGQLGGTTGNSTGLYFPSSIGFAGGADDNQAPTSGNPPTPNYAVNLPAATGAGSGGALGLTFGSIDSAFNLNVRLSALESQGTVKIISSPKITTLDNKSATISQGVSIPISQVSAQGVQTSFFDATLALNVKPHVTQDGNIYLEIQANNDTPDFQNVGARGDPTILKKEAKTELLLKDGDTTVIGGIYTRNSGYSRAQVPFFARIPILGALFRTSGTSDRRTEMLIFVTPRIVNRSAATVRTAR